MRFPWPRRSTPQLAWEPCAPCPNARTEPAAAQAGHLFLVMGGYQHIDHVLGIVDVFDLDQGRWTDQIAMPPGTPQTHAGIACGEDRFLYVVGGQVGPHCSPAVRGCFVLDVRAREWGRLPSLPEARYSPTVQVWNGRLHVISGARPDRWTSSCDHWSIAVAGGKALESEWREESPVPRGGPHRASAILGGTLYLLGGQDGDVKPIAGNPEGVCDWKTPLETVYADSFMKKPGADRWEPVSPLATACSHTESVVTLESYAVLAGGNEGRNRLSDVVQVYDSRADLWWIAGRLPFYMKTSAVYHDGWLYAIAGQRSASRDDRRPTEVVGCVWRARFDPAASRPSVGA
jgi:hypothetical protein